MENLKQYRSTYVTVTGIKYRITTKPTANAAKQIMTLKMVGERFPASNHIINTSDKLATAAKAEINSWLKKTL